MKTIDAHKAPTKRIKQRKKEEEEEEEKEGDNQTTGEKGKGIISLSFLLSSFF